MSDIFHEEKLKRGKSRYGNESDLIPGGLADKDKAKDFDPEQLAAGLKVELEHTSEKAIALEIAKDHLKEDPDYYKKLKKAKL